MTGLIEETGVVTRTGYVDTPWTIAYATQGGKSPAIGRILAQQAHILYPEGFSLGLIITAAMEAQKSTSQPDMIHISALYHKNVSTGPYEVRIRKTKDGKSMSYFDADLLQKGSIRVASRCIFGVLPDLTNVAPDKRVTIHQSSPLARRIPLMTHPSDAQHSFVDLTADLPVHLSEERHFIEKNIKRSNERGDSLQKANGEYMGGTEWAAWCELAEYPGFDPSISPFNLAIIGDISVRPCYLLPEDQKPPPSCSWPATVVLDLEFKSKIPKSADFAQKTVGIYSTGKYMFEGQHDLCIEVWTAPCGVGEEHVKNPNWREKQVCLAVSHQVGVLIPENLRETHAKTMMKAREKAKL